MSGEEFAVLPATMRAITSVTSDGHEADANMNGNVNMTDVATENSFVDQCRKRSISHLSDEDEVENVIKKRRGRPAKSSSFHVRKPRVHKQKEGEKKKVGAIEAAAAAGDCPPLMIDVALQTDDSDFPVTSVHGAISSSVPLTTSAMATFAESMSKRFNEAIEPIVKETGFMTIDIKELLINIRQLASQVVVISNNISLSAEIIKS